MMNHRIISILVGCGFCICAFAWWLCSALALHQSRDIAQICGWWFWGIFAGLAIYLPIMHVLSFIYIGATALALTGVEPLISDHGCIRHDSRRRYLILLLVVNLVVIILTAGALHYNTIPAGKGGSIEFQCIPTTDLLYHMSSVGFLISSVTTALCALVGVAETIYLCYTQS
jgi:hypothetical protein